MVAGKAARVSYTPATPEPESAKALLLPFAAQMHITVPGQEGMWQYLLIRTKPPGLNRKAHNLWPSSTQVHANQQKHVVLFILQDSTARNNLPDSVIASVHC